ncbi:MAG: CHAT domain-containing protein [Scytonematopsis contorta HA4267-MV1]|jgi:hypothetical protein|nr:CHAT domain-containing protein [Scytonematopsis contorta HA4267-MV1]
MVKRQVTQQQKILILAAIPHNLHLDKEIREISECIQRSVRRDMFEVDVRTAVRPQDIRRAIASEKPTIVHFCGHGLEDGSLLLEDDAGKNKAVSPEVLASLFKLHTDYVDCVLLNTCHSVKSASAIKEYINYVIGMNQEIQDKSAIQFAQGFYDGLGYETPENQDVFQRAFQEGLVAIKLENHSQAKIPVLKTRIDIDKSHKLMNIALLLELANSPNDTDALDVLQKQLKKLLYKDKALTGEVAAPLAKDPEVISKVVNTFNQNITGSDNVVQNVTGDSNKSIGKVSGDVTIN